MDFICVYFRMNGHTMIHYLIAAAGILLLIYALLIFYYHRSWDQIPNPSELSQDTIPSVKVSVIIPARNEALHIGKCLDSLLAQSYPRECMEIVVVNDFSTDDTANMVTTHPLNLQAY